MNVRKIIRGAVLLAVQEEAGLYSEVVDESNARIELGLTRDWVWKVVSRDKEDGSPDVLVTMLSGEVVVSVVWYGGGEPADDESKRVERVVLRVYLSDPDFFGKLTGVVGSLGKYYHGVKF